MAGFVHLAGALGPQCSHHQSSARAQVAGAQRCRLQAVYAFDHGHLTVHLNVGTHVGQFICIAETVFPNALGDNAGALGKAQHYGKQGLQIGGKAGMRHGFDLEGVQIAGAAHTHGFIKFLHLAASQTQLCGDGLQMLGNDIAHRNIAAGYCGSHHIAACLNLIRNDGIFTAVHALYTANADHIGACAANFSAHHVQAVGKIHHMGLLGHIFQHGLALGQHGAEHGVHGCAHGNRVKENMHALQAVAVHIDHAVFHRILCPQRRKGFQVLVDGAGAQIAAAGHGHLCIAEAAQQCAQKVVAGAHLARKLVGHLGAGKIGGVDLVGVFIDQAHPGPQLAQDLQRNHHIADRRQVFDHAFSGCQNGGGQNCHSRIFGAADLHLAIQGDAAVDDIFFQNVLLLTQTGLQPKKPAFFAAPYSRASTGNTPNLDLLYHTFALLKRCKFSICTICENNSNIFPYRQKNGHFPHMKPAKARGAALPQQGAPRALEPYRAISSAHRAKTV